MGEKTCRSEMRTKFLEDNNNNHKVLLHVGASFGLIQSG